MMPRTPMEAFPFTGDDWGRVREAALAVLNATLAEDDVLRASLLAELLAVLDELRAGYGDHPLLLEIAAGFHNDESVQRALYRKAICSAEAAGLPTLSIRISLAQLLLEDFDEPTQALAELLSCEAEMRSHADEAQRQEWTELLRQCRRRGAGQTE